MTYYTETPFLELAGSNVPLLLLLLAARCSTSVTAGGVYNAQRHSGELKASSSTCMRLHDISWSSQKLGPFLLGPPYLPVLVRLVTRGATLSRVAPTESPRKHLTPPRPILENHDNNAMRYGKRSARDNKVNQI